MLLNRFMIRPLVEQGLREELSAGDTTGGFLTEQNDPVLTGQIYSKAHGIACGLLLFLDALLLPAGGWLQLALKAMMVIGAIGCLLMAQWVPDSVAVRQRVVEVLGQVRMPDPAGASRAFPHELSGGMQQRASICRALIHQPRLLMLDEPFGALDAFTREELWCVLRDLWEAQRFTVVLVTHDLREAAFLADTVYVMSRRPGRVIERRSIELPRPRALETTYEKPFIDLVQELRAQIGEVRST